MKFGKHVTPLETTSAFIYLFILIFAINNTNMAVVLSY